ncbi:MULTISPECIES: hypothetical protein [unclassified Nocardioides]|uniref:hypothetical protein n=1 Tax=unclassified Nocardioides TaxID=2615069 RepID=UPI0006F4196D|nr:MULTISPECIES: hypothetical protein [unclassified Nocardioides]KRA38403.1 hypothetical protein ASD81_07145 [Nocardioides sp. Root614]
MSDFEEQVGATLAAVAEEAPDASGLAAGARRRHRVRRQRRIAVGGVAAALVVAVSAVALVAGGGDDSIAHDPTERPSGAWQTISEGDLRASLPPDWKAYDCAGDDATPTVYAAPDEDPCGDGTGTYFEDRQTYEPLAAPAVVTRRLGDGRAYWTTFVYLDDRVLNVTTTDRDLARQILATARHDGQPVIDGSRWVSFERNGIGYDIPAFWGVGEKGDRSGYSVCAVSGALDEGIGEQLDDRRYRYNRAFGDHQVTIVAPTSAVADIVWASLNEAPDAVGGGCTEEDFNVGLLLPEGSSGAPVEGEESASSTTTTAITTTDAAVAFGADLARLYAGGGDYPIDMFEVESLMEDGDLARFPSGHRLNTYFRLLTQPGVLFCLVNDTTGEYAAYDSSEGGLIGHGTTDPDEATAFDNACNAAINNG